LGGEDPRERGEEGTIRWRNQRVRLPPTENSELMPQNE
jgi:hypothetical protein